MPDTANAMTRCHAGKSGCFLCSYNSFYMFIMEVHCNVIRHMLQK